MCFFLLFFYLLRCNRKIGKSIDWFFHFFSFLFWFLIEQKVQYNFPTLSFVSLQAFEFIHLLLHSTELSTKKKNIKTSINQNALEKILSFKKKTRNGKGKIPLWQTLAFNKQSRIHALNFFLVLTYLFLLILSLSLFFWFFDICWGK